MKVNKGTTRYAAAARRVLIGCLGPTLIALAAVPSTAVAASADTFSIKETSGTATTNYPVQIGRPFVAGEIQNYPQVGICSDSSCGTVSQWLTTQADVKQHWADGTVKHALLSFYIPRLNANSTVYFTVQNQTACNCGTGLTQAQMLATNYNFDAIETYSNGVTASVSARAILSAWDGTTQGVTGPVYYWAKGVNATTLIIAEHRNTQTCNGHACSSNDFGSDANKSMRPEFHVTFWPLTNQVKIRFIGEIVNTESMQDQHYDLLLSVGAASPTTVYTQAGIQQGVAERWTVARNNQNGQTWTVSTPGGGATLQKEIWLGGVPTPIAVNHNLSYIENTLFTSNYDLSTTPNEAALETFWSAWANTNSNSIYATGGYWNPGMGNAGASPWIGPLPSWVTPWLYTGDIRAQELALRVTDLEGQYPEHMIEGRSGKNLNRSDAPGAGTGVGHVISVSSRPTWMSAISLWAYGSNSADDIHTVGTADDAGWHADYEHEPDFGSAVYALTGDYYYLQEQMFSASWYAGVGNGGSTNRYWGRGPTGAEGGIQDDDVRTVGWYIRTQSMASFIAPDADFGAEKTYFSTLLNDEIAQEEGARCGASDVYGWCASSPFHRNPNWTWGYTYRAQVNNEASAGQGTAYPVLHQWAAGNYVFVEADLDGVSDYGIGATAGTGAITTSGTSNTAILSDASQCAALYVNQPIYVYQDNGGSISSGASSTYITAKACPAITTADSLTLTQGGGRWFYSKVAQSAVSQFSSDYLMYAIGRATELGFPAANLRSWFAQFFVGLINDPGSNPRLSFNGRMPTIDAATGSYITSYARLKQAFQTEWESLGSGFAPAGEGNAPPEGYPAYARAAYSMLYAEPGGSSAWNFFVSNVNSDASDFASNPQWALLPRASANSAPITTPTANKCDLNNDGIVNVLDVQIAVAQSTGALPCTLSTCSSSTVTSLVSTVLGGACELQ